jgi:PBP1b-binding outer membrane lipoprotein LpoB
MGPHKISTVALAVSFILGCSSGHSPDPPAGPAPPAKTVFDPLTQQLKKAQDVQKAADANADSTRQAVDHQEHGDSPP